MPSVLKPAQVSATPRSADAPAIDLVHLARQTLGDSALETELLGLFERQAGQIMAQIEAASVGSERQFRRDLAHTLKGSARAVGVPRVASAAQSYEDALSSPVTEEAISYACEGLAGAVSEARAAISDLLRER